MQSSSRAPLLSATLSTDSCWIISASLLQHFGDAPAGFLGDRARLDDAYAIADANRVRLVVDLEAPGMADDLLVERVRLEVLHHHDHGLLHLVAHDHAVARLAARTRRLDRVTHRHPPGRRRFPRQPPLAPGFRRRELLRERPPGPRGASRPWAPAARGRASPSPGPVGQPQPR